MLELSVIRSNKKVLDFRGWQVVAGLSALAVCLVILALIFVNEPSTVAFIAE